MNYKKIEMNGYNLYFIKTTKFKTVNVSLNFIRKLTKEEEVYCALLRRILNYATNKYHNLDELCRAGMNIYGPSVNIGFDRIGLNRIFFLETTFVSDKYTEEGMNEKSIQYALSHIWDPYVQNGEFNKEIFDICLNEYIEAMNHIKDNPDNYCNERVWEELEVYPFGEMNPKECAEFASKLTAKDLYEYYLTLFEEDSLDIFVTGDVDEEKLKNTIDKIVKGNFKPTQKIQSVEGVERKEKKIVETIDAEQSKLAVGLRYMGLTDFERKYVSLAYNNILGSGWNSKLNKTVRLDNSLCYYIYSVRKIQINVAIIYSGIDNANADKTIKLIKEEIKNMHENVTEEELNRVKEIYNNALTEIEDSRDAITSNIVSQVLADTDSIEDRRKNMAKVTVQDIQNMAKKVHIDTIYLLEGNGHDEEESI